MVNRGGGVFDLVLRKVPRKDRLEAPESFLKAAGKRDDSSYWLIVHLCVDVCDAMG